MPAEYQTYAQFRPTSYDTRGLGCKDQQDWLVAPCSQTRDSGALDRSNFEVTQRILTEAGAEFEVHRFGHWGPGWFEIVLVSPEWAHMLPNVDPDDYPVLDDSHLSETEAEDEWNAWESWGYRDFSRALVKAHPDAERAIDLLSIDALASLFYDTSVDVEHSDEGPDFRVDTAVLHVSRSSIAKAVRAQRIKNRTEKGV